MRHPIFAGWPLAAGAAAQPAGKVFLAGPHPLTYGVLADRVARVGSWLAGAGLGPGSRVAIAIAADDLLIPLFLGLLRFGAVPLVLDPAAAGREARELLAWLAPDALLLDEGLPAAWDLPACPVPLVLPVARPAPAGLLDRVFSRPGPDPRYPGCLAGLAPATPRPGPAADDLAYVLFTSGSTARPKGVELTHGAVQAHMATFARQLGYGPDMRLLNVLALHHTDGLFNGVLAAFAAGGTLVRPHAFALDRLSALEDALYAERVTHFVTVPTMLALLIHLATEPAEPARDLRMIVSSAATLEPRIWEAAQARWGAPVVNVYGLTESTCGSLYAGPDAAGLVVGSVGRAIDCEVRLLGPDGAPCAVDQAGELWLRGPHLMRGYHRDPAATAAALVDGWLATGDRASLGADGVYRLHGRSKRVIVTGGHNVSPEEVAAVLASHPAVREAVALGQPDPTWGELVVAFVALAPPPGQAAPGPDALAAYCQANLAAYKVPAAIHVLDALPRLGPAGKVRLDALLGLVPGEPPRDRPDPDLAATVYALAARCFRTPLDALGPASSPDTLGGWTSLAHMGLATALENALGIRLGPRDVMAMTSLGAVVDLARARLAERT